MVPNKFIDQVFGIMPDGEQGKVPGYQYIKMRGSAERQLFHLLGVVVYHTKQADGSKQEKRYRW